MVIHGDEFFRRHLFSSNISKFGCQVIGIKDSRNTNAKTWWSGTSLGHCSAPEIFLILIGTQAMEDVLISSKTSQLSIYYYYQIFFNIVFDQRHAWLHHKPVTPWPASCGTRRGIWQGKERVGGKKKVPATCLWLTFF